MTRAQRDAARFLDMLRAAGAPVPDGAQFVRAYPGPSARSEGAWSWFLADAVGNPLHPDIGSQWPRHVLLRAGVEVSWDRHTTAWQVDPKSWEKVFPRTCAPDGRE